MKFGIHIQNWVLFLPPPNNFQLYDNILPTVLWNILECYISFEKKTA